MPREFCERASPPPILHPTAYGIRRREAREATSWLACLTLRSPQDKKRATAYQHLICPEFDVKFRIETIFQRAAAVFCSCTSTRIVAWPDFGFGRMDHLESISQGLNRLYLHRHPDAGARFGRL